MRKASGLDDAATLLFSESNTRFLVEVPREHRDEFESVFSGLPIILVGRVTDGSQFRVSDGNQRSLIDSSLTDLKRAWKSPLAWD